MSEGGRGSESDTRLHIGMDNGERTRRAIESTLYLCFPFVQLSRPLDQSNIQHMAEYGQWGRHAGRAALLFLLIIIIIDLLNKF